MSDTLESLRRKIDGAHELASVVRTMKALSAANIAQFENAVEALSEYYRTIELGLSVSLRAMPSNLKFAPPEERRNTIGIIVFGSDQGLVGKFNDHLADCVVRKHDRDLKIWTVGERVAVRLLDAGRPAHKVLAVPTAVSAITPLVTTLLTECEALRSRGQLAELHVLHNKPVAAGTYEPVRQRLLPLDEAWQGQLRLLPWPTKNIPQPAPNGANLLPALIYEYLFVSLFKACAESLASENASRLAAMQRAERNIREILVELTQHFHRERQDSIDAELFDVLAGYEVLDKKSDSVDKIR